MSLNYSWKECSPEARVWFDLNFEQNVWNLSCASVAVGIPQITEENADKFWDRYCAIQWVNGSPAYVSEKLVKFAVGFSTNATPFTDTQFNKRLAKMVLENAKDFVEQPNTKEIDERIPGVAAE